MVIMNAMIGHFVCVEVLQRLSCSILIVSCNFFLCQWITWLIILLWVYIKERWFIVASCHQWRMKFLALHIWGCLSSATPILAWEQRSFSNATVKKPLDVLSSNWLNIFLKDTSYIEPLFWHTFYFLRSIISPSIFFLYCSQLFMFFFHLPRVKDNPSLGVLVLYVQ